MRLRTYSRLRFALADVQLARDITGNELPIRTPHHTTRPPGICLESSLARGGVLIIEDVTKLTEGALRALEEVPKNIIGQPGVPLVICIDPSDMDDATHARYNEILDRIEKA